MTTICHIVLHQEAHHKASCHVFQVEVDETKYSEVTLPGPSRNSTSDAVKFDEVRKWLSWQLLLTKTMDLDTHIKVLQYLRYAYAYRAYHSFAAEYADVIRLRLMREYQARGENKAPTMEDIVDIMKKDGFFHDADSSRMCEFTNKSYDEDKINDPLYKHYFNKLGVSKERNHLTPEDYLGHQWDMVQHEEPLLHVRACEDIGCSINPHKSKFTQLISDNAHMKIVEAVIEKQYDKEKTFNYAGFASGYLLRDAEMIQALIQHANIKYLQLFFIDKSYATLIDTVLDPGKPDMQTHIEATLLYKSVLEFTEWLSSKLPQDEKNPLTLHFFSDAKDAKHYLKKTGQHLNLLVAQDYFTDDGCHSNRYATPGAHSDFKQLARQSLGEGDLCFELLKNDRKEEVYSRKVTVKQHHRMPLSSKIWNTREKESKIVVNTPSSLFQTSKKDAKCLVVQRKYNEQGELLDIARYSK
jgi:hypothetical protein